MPIDVFTYYRDSDSRILLDSFHRSHCHRAVRASAHVMPCCVGVGVTFPTPVFRLCLRPSPRSVCTPLLERLSGCHCRRWDTLPAAAHGCVWCREMGIRAIALQWEIYGGLRCDETRVEGGGGARGAEYAVFSFGVWRLVCEIGKAACIVR